MSLLLRPPFRWIRIAFFGYCICIPTLHLAAQQACRVPTSNPGTWLTLEQRYIADQLISLVENDTPVFQYGYVEDIGDGRGLTVGRGFTTETGDAAEVIVEYSRRPDRQVTLARTLERYLPSLSGIGGRAARRFQQAWEAAAEDPAFRAAQDSVLFRNSYRPAMALADSIGLQSPLSRTVLYDAFVQRGAEGARQVLTVGGGGLRAPRPAGWPEERWVSEFLNARVTELSTAGSPVDRASAAPRIAVYRTVADQCNFGLVPPVRVETVAHTAILGRPPLSEGRWRELAPLPITAHIVKITEYGPADRAKIDAALALAVRVVNLPEFRAAVLAYGAGDPLRSFAGTRGRVLALPNAEVWALFSRAAEEFEGGPDAEMDLYLVGAGGSGVGYGYPGQPEIYTYRSWLRRSDVSVADLADHIVHEWTHKIGFEHDYRSTRTRPCSVPYAIGSLVGFFAEQLSSGQAGVRMPDSSDPEEAYLTRCDHRLSR